jgi:hypothetical protein
MSKSQAFAIRLLSAVAVGGRRALAGTVLEIDARTAAQWIRDGRARLVNNDDIGPLFDATAGLRERSPDGR